MTGARLGILRLLRTFVFDEIGGREKHVKVCYVSQLEKNGPVVHLVYYIHVEVIAECHSTAHAVQVSNFHLKDRYFQGIVGNPRRNKRQVVALDPKLTRAQTSATSTPDSIPPCPSSIERKQNC